MKPLPQTALDFTAPYSDRQTSMEAAYAISDHIQRMEARVLAALRECPLTAQEIEDRTGLDGNSVRPRLVALRERGLVVHTDERRLTRSGRPARVWRVAP